MEVLLLFLHLLTRIRMNHYGNGNKDCEQEGKDDGHRGRGIGRGAGRVGGIFLPADSLKNRPVPRRRPDAFTRRQVNRLI